MKYLTNSHILCKSLFASLLVLWVFAGCSRPDAEVADLPEVVYPRFRQEASPAGGKVSDVNPAPLLWEYDGAGSRYKVFLSRKKDASQPCFESDTIAWAVYTPHQKLDVGRWYWKYETFSADGEKSGVSAVYDFVIDETSAKVPTPTLEKFLSAAEGGHPRMYVRSDGVGDFRSRNRGSADAAKVIGRADRLLLAPLPDDTPTRPRDTTGLRGFEFEMMMTFMYHLYGDKVKEPVEYGVLAWLLTGEEKYEKMAIRHAMHIADMDPNGYPTREDFNTASVMLAMAQAYDTFHDKLTVEQKSKLLEAIRVRATHIYERTMVGRFETQVMNNHIWQHVLRRFFLTALATVGELPQAEEWLSYCYEVWCCRFPVIGGQDGGAPDGNSYFPVNFETFVYMPMMLGEITGEDFFAHPWYDNVGYYLIYSFPPHGISTQFGDEHEYLRSRPWRYFGFIDALARETGNPHLNTYLEKWLCGDSEAIHDDEMFLLYRLLTEKPYHGAGFESYADLPLARLFKDTGVAVMRSNLVDNKDDLMVSFTSAPFGATGHAHANHNSFSINYGGEAMFGSTGYYSHFSDRHNLLHYRNSRGHNTILVEGLSQRIGEEGYGWIPRFDTGDGFTYVQGDAKKAYGEVVSGFWLDRMEKVGVNPGRSDGFGDPGLVRFRRHLMKLGESVVVIIDDLAAKEPVRWDFMLHSPYGIVKSESVDRGFAAGDVVSGFSVSSNAGTRSTTGSGAPGVWSVCRFGAHNPKGRAEVAVMSMQSLESFVTDEFAEPAVNWRQLTNEKTGKVMQYTPHYHAYIGNVSKCAAMSFLTVISVGDGILPRAEILQDGSVTVDGWSISVGQGENERLRFSVVDSRGDGVYYNHEKVRGHKSRYRNSTWVVRDGNLTELIDELPASMR